MPDMNQSIVTADMTLTKGMLHAADEETKQIIYELVRRVQAVRVTQDRLRDWCDRADLLYYAEAITTGGADVWPNDPSAYTPGRSHVSVNSFPVYVDVPSALQSLSPIENMAARDADEDSRRRAAAQERLYVAWKREEEFDLKWHKANIVKSLYGITAARVWWEPGVGQEKGRPRVEMVEQPRNLYLGWKTDEYQELEWAAYVTRYDPNALAEAFNVDVIPFKEHGSGTIIPLVQYRDWNTVQQRQWLANGEARVEVWDYWYRKPKYDRKGNVTAMVTANILIAGNIVIRGPIEYPEYEGTLPYIPVFNTFIPGLPTGRSDLYDAEQLIREKMEKITAGAQMISNAVNGDFWQLVGENAPTRGSIDLEPVKNGIISPGPGNRVEAITPFIAQFQLEQFIGRLDRELAEVTGLNDFLRGVVSTQTLNSSKAINALVASYETRLAIRRELLYKWRRQIWSLVVKVWSKKDADVRRDIIGEGMAYLDIENPSLSPRDESETAMRASNLVSAKLISQERGMDMVGVDDPEAEMQFIREESTDATLWPDRVQVMAQLLAALQSLGLPTPEGAAGQMQGQVTSGQADLRTALGLGTSQVGPGGPGPGGAPEDQGQTPPIEGLPPEAGGPPAPFAQGAAAGDTTRLQSMIQGGKASGRLLSQQTLGRR